MRNAYAAILFAACSAFTAQAQVVHLEDEQGNSVHGTTIYGDCQWTTDTVSLLTTLNGSVAKTINVRRHELWPVSGSKNFFCWGVCYLPANSGSYPTWVSTDPVDMTPGVEINNFHSYYQPFGSTETTLFRFVWYDLDNPNAADSAWVDIYYCGQVGVEEKPALTTSLNLWPSPSIGGDVQLAYSLSAATGNSRLVLHNMLGEQVRSLRIAGSNGRVLLGTADLQAGVYFVNLESDGRVLATQRLVVAR